MKQPRPSSASKAGNALLIALGSLALVAVLAFVLFSIAKPPAERVSGEKPLLVYCAAGLKGPVEAAAAAFEKETGIPVQLQYGGSGTLLSNLKVAKTGDLYIAADQSYMDIAARDGLTAETIPLARQSPVIAVKKGNPKQIKSLADLGREDVSVALANPDAASIGKLTKSLLEESGQWSQVEDRAKVFKPTVNEVANDIKLGAVDAGIIWDATAKQYPDLEAVEVPELSKAKETVSVGVLNSTETPARALKFARFLNAPDRGQQEFARYHFEGVDGDVWKENPEVNLFAGAMLRAAIEKTIADFEQREGVRVTTVYNGCGILTAQMRAGAKPDGYFSCDTSFMTTVADMYMTPVSIASNDLVIIVPKGNPGGVEETSDLARKDLRLGLPHPEKSATGALTKNLLVAQGVFDEVSANAKVDSPTGDFLVNQLRTGSLDVVIACRSNATSAGDDVEMIEIDHPLSKAVQPYANARASEMPRLMARLQAVFESQTSKQRFEQAGFHWMPDGGQ